MSAHYVAAFTDSGCIHGCDHQHATITTAVRCISCAGGYVIAIENSCPRCLTLEEEQEFQHALCAMNSLAEDALAKPAA